MLTVPHRDTVRAAFIYLVQSAEDANTSIYKIGRSSQQAIDGRRISRLHSYPVGTMIEMVIRVRTDHVVEVEDAIKQTFKKKYRLVKGSEWFEGNVRHMQKDILALIDEYEDKYIESLAKFGLTIDPLTPRRYETQTRPDVRSFGEENVEYLTPQFLDNILQNLLSLGVIELLQAIHFNPEHPENQNIWVEKNSMKGIYCIVLDNANVQKTEVEVWDMIIKNICSMLVKHVLDKKTRQTDNTLENTMHTFVVQSKLDRIAKLKSTKYTSNPHIMNRKALHQQLLNMIK